jgi:hypothetical protein
VVLERVNSEWQPRQSGLEALLGRLAPKKDGYRPTLGDWGRKKRSFKPGGQKGHTLEFSSSPGRAAELKPACCNS